MQHKAHWFQEPQEAALAPGTEGGPVSSQEGKLFSRRVKDRVVSYPRSHPVVSLCPSFSGLLLVLSCPDLMSCILPHTPGIQESMKKITHLAGKTTREKTQWLPSHPPCLCQRPAFPRARVKSQFHFYPPSLTGLETSSHPSTSHPGPTKETAH